MFFNQAQSLIEFQSEKSEAAMRIFAFTLSLITLSFEFTLAKRFDQCELAIELYEKHEVPRDEIYIHLCIVSTLHTSRNSDGHLGIYSIGSRWWCGNDAPGGSCNVTCADLLDDDIADDVFCANLIMSQQGVEAWGETAARCKYRYGNETEKCLVEEEIYDDFENFTFSVNAPVTTTTTQRTTQRTSTRMTTTKETSQNDDENSDAIIWIIVAVLTVILITLFVVKLKPKITSRVSYKRNQEFENTLSNL